MTSYDALTAGIFDEAGIELLLVGDSAANVVYGRETTLSLTLDETITMAKAVVAATQRAFVVVDLPFGSYEASPSQALESAVRVMKETGAHAVKFEGGAELAPPTVEKLVAAGIPVCAHIGFTPPQSVHALGGFRVQGRGDQADRLLADASSLATAGAFAVVLEMVPAPVAARVTKTIDIPTIGIGAGGADTDGQILVWTDMAGLSTVAPRFSRTYADLRATLTEPSPPTSQTSTPAPSPPPRQKAFRTNADSHH